MSLNPAIIFKLTILPREWETGRAPPDNQGKTGFREVLDFVVFTEKRFKLVYENERILSVISSDRTKLVWEMLDFIGIWL